jgi:hypothetical protein
MVWENERTTNDNVNRLLEHQYLGEAYESVDLSRGRGNRILFLTRTGMTWVLKHGHVREEDIAYHWKGQGDWHPSYSDHNVSIHDVLCGFIMQARDHPEKAIDIRLDPHAPLGGREELSNFQSPLQDNTLIPDRIFSVKYYNQVAEFYLEVDLNTEGKPKWREKMDKYRMCPEVIEQGGAFVLCVASDKRRMGTLLDWSKDLVDERFRFSYLDSICYTYKRGADKELVLANEGRPFGQVWRVTTNEELHPLVEDWLTG